MDGFSYSAAALISQVTFDDGDDDSALGYAVFGAAKFSVTDNLTIPGALSLLIPVLIYFLPETAGKRLDEVAPENE